MLLVNLKFAGGGGGAVSFKKYHFLSQSQTIIDTAQTNAKCVSRLSEYITGI